MTLTPEDYAQLLGLSLGDGCISPHRRGVFHLRIALDVRYPRIIEECREAVASVIGKWPGLTPAPGCVHVSSWSKQWPCLVPQHGPGKEHERPIVLADWRRARSRRSGVGRSRVNYFSRRTHGPDQ